MIDVVRQKNGLLDLSQFTEDNLAGKIVRVTKEPSADELLEIKMKDPSKLSDIPCDEFGNKLSTSYFGIVAVFTKPREQSKNKLHVLALSKIATQQATSDKIEQAKNQDLLFFQESSIVRMLVYDSLEELPAEVMLMVTSNLSGKEQGSWRKIPELHESYTK